MAGLSVAKGSAGFIKRIFIQDSTKTDGSGLTGLTSGSSGLTACRMRDDDGNAGATAISLSAGTLGTWSSGGFAERDATKAPGWYEFGVPTAALLTGSRSVSFELKGAASMAPCPFEFELTGPDNQTVVQPANVTQWKGSTPASLSGLGNVPSDAQSYVGNGINAADGNGNPPVNVADWNTHAVTVDSGNLPSVGVGAINGVGTTSVTAVDANVGTTQPTNFSGTGASAYVKSDPEQWKGGTIPSPNVTGVPFVDLKYALGTIITCGAAAGVPDVAAKYIGTTATGNPTAIGAIIGNDTHKITVDSSGYVTANMNGDFTATQKTSGATFSQTGAAAAIVAALLINAKVVSYATGMDPKSGAYNLFCDTADGNDSHAGTNWPSAVLTINQSQTISQNLLNGNRIVLALKNWPNDPITQYQYFVGGTLYLEGNAGMLGDPTLAAPVLYCANGGTLRQITMYSQNATYASVLFAGEDDECYWCYDCDFQNIADGGGIAIQTQDNTNLGVYLVNCHFLGEILAGVNSPIYLINPIGEYTTSGPVFLLPSGPIKATNGSGNPLAPASATTNIYNRLGAPAGASMSADIAALLVAIGNITNLSSLANIYGPAILEIPASGSIAYPFTVLIKDEEGHQLDLTGSPTLTCTNAAGTDRSGNLSAVTHPATGVYEFTYTVASNAAEEGLRLGATGTASSDSTSRVAYYGAAVVSVDTAAAIAAIKAKTDLIATNSMDSPNAVTAQGNASTAATQATGANTEATAAASSAATAASNASTAATAAGTAATAAGTAATAATAAETAAAGVQTYLNTNMGANGANLSEIPGLGGAISLSVNISPAQLIAAGQVPASQQLIGFVGVLNPAYIFAPASVDPYTFIGSAKLAIYTPGENGAGDAGIAGSPFDGTLDAAKTTATVLLPNGVFTSVAPLKWSLYDKQTGGDVLVAWGSFIISDSGPLP